ncbi:MAG: P-loop NTPase fold protein, partial [Candidatus Heimdallarchaeaceae archaeon]
MKENNYPKYLDNKPIGEDQFEGKSHERISSSIAEHIKDKNNSLGVIGIEGEWGSGKSNLIELLRKELKNKYYIYIYDAWGHQEDSQRRAFLEELTEELIDEGLLSEKANYKDLSGKEKNITWKEKIKFLLARKRETNKKTIPKLSIGIIVIGIVLVLTPIFTLVADILFNENTEWWKRLLLPLSPIIISILFYLFASAKKKKWVNISELFFIFKGKELENTTYEIFSDLAPSVKEFKEWIKSISQGLTKKELVIVYDNMDRLPPEKVKEIWSSIHTFFAEERYEKINIIITFDRIHLQKAFEDKAEKTSEFINKTFSIIYRVTPPVLTDWKDFFTKKYKDAFGETEENEFPIVLSVFDRLKKKFTPRDIIIFINELVTYKKIWTDEIPLRYIAVFSIKKEDILKEPQKSILSNEYLGAAKDLFTEDESLANYISALTFNVPVKKASQVLLVRDLELALRGEGTSTIGELSEHPHFIEILEEVIQNSDIVVEKAIPILSKLEIEKINGSHIKTRIEKVWDTSVTKQCSIKISKLSFEEKYKSLLRNSSKGSKLRFLKYLVSQFNEFNEIDGIDYYTSFKDLEDFLDEEKIEFKVQNYLKIRNVTPEIFLNYLSVACSEYKKYKLETDNDELDNFISEKIPNELDSLSNINNLSFISDDYSFEATTEEIEDLISTNKLTKDNFHNILTLYKLVSTDKPLNKIVTTSNLYNLLQNTTYKDDGYYDLLAIRLQYGNTYNQQIVPKGWRDITAQILSQTEEELVTEISKRIEYYTTYGGLLLLSTTWNQPLLNAICRNLVVNIYETQKLNITKALEKFEEIKDAIEIDAEKLLKSFNGWTKYAKQEITSENIEEIIPDYSFYEYSTSILLELTNYINNTVKKYINSIDKETLIEEWGNDESYVYNILYIFMYANKIKTLPRNVFNAIKQILKRISESEIEPPESDSLWA